MRSNKERYNNDKNLYQFTPTRAMFSTYICRLSPLRPNTIVVFFLLKPPLAPTPSILNLYKFNSIFSKPLQALLILLKNLSKVHTLRRNYYQNHTTLVVFSLNFRSNNLLITLLISFSNIKGWTLHLLRYLLLRLLT